MTDRDATPASDRRDSGREVADLLDELANARRFLRYTTRDLTDDRARQRTTVSELTLGALIKHVTMVEQVWARFTVEGPSALSFGNPEAAEARRRGLQMGQHETLAELLEAYGETAQRTDELLMSSDLDSTQPLPEASWFPPGAVWSTRRVALHLIAETAQHAGHADIIRESLDGAKSMG